MDGGTEGHSTIWSRLSKLFGHDDEESLEKAILDAPSHHALDAIDIRMA